MSIPIQLAESGFLSDGLIRSGIRRLLRARLRTISQDPKDAADWVRELEQRPLAEDTDAANEQHYEIPADYFTAVLGRHLKYSSGYWPEGVDGLDDSEAAMLRLTCERAELRDGQRVLELGCGWGSLSLWMAENYPSSRILALSNSNSQRAHIEKQCELRGIENLEVRTCDIQRLRLPTAASTGGNSVEMFEHRPQPPRALPTHRGMGFVPEGKVFVHIFAHPGTLTCSSRKVRGTGCRANFFTGGNHALHRAAPDGGRGLPPGGGALAPFFRQWEALQPHARSLAGPAGTRGRKRSCASSARPTATTPNSGASAGASFTWPCSELFALSERGRMVCHALPLRQQKISDRAASSPRWELPALSFGESGI